MRTVSKNGQICIITEDIDLSGKLTGQKTKNGIITMEIYLDVDGVILDFESSMIDFIRDGYMPDLPQDYVLESWEMTDEFKTLDIQKVWEEFVNSSRFSQLELLANTDSFNRLSSRYPVFLITNVPGFLFDQRQKNLERYQLVYNEMHFAGHFDFGDKDYPTKPVMIEKLHQKGKRIVFLDDHPKNCLNVKEHFPDSEVFLMSRPHNKTLEDQDWTRVKDWEDFINKIM